MTEQTIDHSDFLVDEDENGNLYFPDSEQGAIIEEYFDEENLSRNSILIRVHHAAEGLGCVGLDMDFESLTFWPDDD